MMEILELYKNCYAAKEEYCVLCMRSGKERRMVNTKNLQEFILGINLPFSYYEDFQRVCYVCSSQAAAAHRVRLAVNLSGAIHHLFLMMARSAKYANTVRNQVEGNQPLTGVGAHAVTWPAQLAAVRSRTQLLHTDVLSINTLSPHRQGPVSHNELPGSCADVYVVPDAPPSCLADLSREISHGMSHESRDSPGHGELIVQIQEERNETQLPDVLSEPEIYMDSVVMDEERDPIEIKPEPGDSGGDQPFTNIVPIEQLMETATDDTSFLLHPIVEVAGVMTVPSLGAQLVNGQLITVDSSSLIIQTPKLAIQDGTNINLLTDPNKVATMLKSLSGMNLSNVSVICEDNRHNYVVSEVNSTVRGTDTGQDESLPFNMLQKQRHRDKAVSNEVQSIVIDDESETGVSAKRRQKIRGSDSDDSVKRRKEDQSETAVPSSNGTDWEDKIPMDVISFMDATDPNAPSVTAPAVTPSGHHTSSLQVDLSNLNLFVQNPRSLTGNNQTVTGNNQTVTGNTQPRLNASTVTATYQTVRRNNQTVTANNQTVTRHNLTVTATNQTVTANNLKVTANNQTVTANQVVKNALVQKYVPPKVTVKQSASVTSRESVHQNVHLGRGRGRGRGKGRGTVNISDTVVIDLC